MTQKTTYHKKLKTNNNHWQNIFITGVFSLFLQFSPVSILSQQPFYKCEGDTISIGSEMFIDEGVYNAVFIDRNGLDSLVLVEVFNYPSYETNLLQELCPGEFINGQIYYNDTTIVRHFISQNGCDSIISTIIDIQDVNLEEIEGDKHLCYEESTILSAGHYESYLWNTGETTQEISISEAGTYSVIVSNSYGCADSISTIVTNSIISADIDITHVSCKNHNTGIIELKTIYSSNPIAEILVNGNNHSTSNSNIENLDARDYRLRFVDDQRCEWDTLVTVNEPDHELDLSINLDQNNIYTGENINPEFVSNIDLTVANWHINEIYYDAFIHNSIPVYHSDYLTLEVVDINSCATSRDVWVSITEPHGLIVPNAFSPNNNDGNNDYFLLGSDKFLERIDEISVWDRWGNMVFSDKDINSIDQFQWDGTYKGQPLNQGSYIIQIQYNYMGKPKSYINSLTIL